MQVYVGEWRMGKNFRFVELDQDCGNKDTGPAMSTFFDVLRSRFFPCSIEHPDHVKNPISILRRAVAS